MPWFFADPDAKPVGPLSLEELHAQRSSGRVNPETYVIEQVPGTVGVWKRYRELFPHTETLPPLPAAVVLTPPAPPIPAATPSVPNPLFPSAPFAPVQAPTYSPVQLRPSEPVPLHHDHLAPTAKANVWCAWGFGLGIGSFLGLVACGLGMFVAPIGFVVSIMGLVKVQRHPGETGRGMAITGLALSSLSMLVALIILISVAVPAIREHERTVTEQTSNDSE